MVVSQGRPRCTHREEEAAAAAEEGGAAREVSAAGLAESRRGSVAYAPSHPPGGGGGFVPWGPRARTHTQLSSTRSDVCRSPSLTPSSRDLVGARAAPPRGVPGARSGAGGGGVD